MKKLCTLFLLLSVQQAAMAQNDSLMPNLSATYVVECYGEGGAASVNEFNFVNPNLAFDTVEVYDTSESLIAKIYMDTLKVWINRISEIPSCYVGWTDDLTNDWELLYDFGLSVGDPAYQVFSGAGVITSIEELEVQGVIRKKFIVDNGIDAYIQGVGSISHPFISKMYMFENAYTICNSNLYYSGPASIDSLFFSPDCDGEILSVGNLVTTNFELYPNPSSGYVNLSFEGLAGGTVKIITLAGQVMETHQMNSDSPRLIWTHLDSDRLPSLDGRRSMAVARLDVSELPKGVYFVVLETEAGNAVKKMVVN